MKPAGARKWIGRRWGHFEFVRVLLNDRLFRWALAVVLLIGLAGTLALPRMWRVTPEGFPGGTIRVNGVDLIQARTLARTARLRAAAGDWDAALYAWRSALANNPGDPRLYRGCIDLLRVAPHRRTGEARLARACVFWLMALTSTNRGDLPRAADVLEKYHAPEFALHFLASVPIGEDEAVDRARARCLIAAGRLEEFDRLWRESGAGWGEDPGLALCRDAFVAITDDGVAGIEAMGRLRDAMAREDRAAVHAARLVHQVGTQRGWLDDLAAAVDRLERAGAASAAHHASYWRSLAAGGELERARSLATTYPRSAEDAEEFLARIHALESLGLWREALSQLDTSIEAHSESAELWGAYLELLSRAGRWTDLHAHAARLRVAAPRQSPLFAEALLADYRAACGEGRTHDAGGRADELAAFTPEQPETALRIARALRTGGHARSALSLLRRMESQLSAIPEFWTELFGAAHVLREVEELRRAADGLARLDPDNLLHANNRAALLLLTGENPAEALQLTLAAWSRNPSSIPLRINHALALIQNARIDEAERLLADIPAARLTGSTAANFHYAMAEIHGAKARWRAALETAAGINREELFPQQQARLERLTAMARRQRATGP